MEEAEVKNIHNLKSHFDKYGDGFLFRGQTGRHLDDNNNVSIQTSFTRRGCIPPLMFKWSHYSKSLIRAFGGGNYHDLDLGLSQAILQHYGWRSFFIDATKSPRIASWFAANKYSENRRIHMCEDFEENPVWLVHKEGAYSNSTSQGHIYIIDINYLSKHKIKVHDLSIIANEEGRLRFKAQSACLIEGVSGVLPPEAIACHLIVDNEVLQEFYEIDGPLTTLDVFPSRNDDYILKSLLELPWYKGQSNNIDFPIPFYRRSLEIPEYDSTFIKHLPPEVTLFNQFWISENRQGEETVFFNLPFYKISEQAYFANTNETFDLSEVNNILENHNGFFIELDGLIKIPELGQSYEYEKGIFVQKVEKDLVSVLGLTIEHPGHVVGGVGANMGWFYKINNGIWERVDHEEQCPCNNDLRHELQFSLLRALNESLKEGDIVKEDDLNYMHRELIHA